MKTKRRYWTLAPLCLQPQSLQGKNSSPALQKQSLSYCPRADDILKIIKQCNKMEQQILPRHWAINFLLVWQGLLLWLEVPQTLQQQWRFHQLAKQFQFFPVGRSAIIVWYIPSWQVKTSNYNLFLVYQPSFQWLDEGAHADLEHQIYPLFLQCCPMER